VRCRADLDAGKHACVGQLLARCGSGVKMAEVLKIVFLVVVCSRAHNGK
jgi:hypothetical protein